MNVSRRRTSRAVVVAAIAFVLPGTLYAQPREPCEREERRIGPPPPEEVSLIGGALIGPGLPDETDVPAAIPVGEVRVTVVENGVAKPKAPPPKAHAPVIPVATPAGLVVACFAALVILLTLLWAAWRFSRGGTRKEPS